MLEPTPGPELIDALTGIASTEFIRGRYPEAVEAADRALALAEEHGLATPGAALGLRGLSRCDLGDLGGLADAERALGLLLAAGEGRGASVLQHNLACMLWYVEGPAAAVASLDAKQEFAIDRGLVKSAEAARASSVVFLADNGRFDEALTRAESLLPQLRDSGNRLFEHDVLAGQAFVLDERGEDAVGPAEQALEIARGTGDAAYLAFAAWGAAPALISAGRIREARDLLEAVAGSKGHDHAEYGHHFPRLARAAHDLDDDELIARLVAGVPDRLPRQQHANVTVRALQAERAGAYAEAAALYADAADRWEQFTELIEQAHALLGQGRCLAAADDPGADLPIRRARALFEQVGARRRIDECDALIARGQRLTG
jgi:tetratricopeptide (TPR) repeat protein